MSNIIPQIYKDPLPKGFLYPLKYQDVKDCFSSYQPDDIYLAVSFNNRQAYWQEERNKLKLEGKYTIVHSIYSPNTPVYYTSHPWQNIENSIVISIRIYAIPENLKKICGIDRTTLGNILL